MAAADVKGKGKAKPPPGSLSAIVLSLVRAQHGISEDIVPDEDLDRHVADLMIQEAQERQKSWGTMGYKAYLPDYDEPTAPVHRPNKRFLNNIIRNVDDHNQALLRSEAETAGRKADEVAERERAEYSRWRDEQLRERSESRSRHRDEDRRDESRTASSRPKASSRSGNGNNRLFGNALQGMSGSSSKEPRKRRSVTPVVVEDDQEGPGDRDSDRHRERDSKRPESERRRRRSRSREEEGGAERSHRRRHREDDDAEPSRCGSDEDGDEERARRRRRRREEELERQRRRSPDNRSVESIRRWKVTKDVDRVDHDRRSHDERDGERRHSKPRHTPVEVEVELDDDSVESTKRSRSSKDEVNGHNDRSRDERDDEQPRSKRRRTPSEADDEPERERRRRRHRHRSRSRERTRERPRERQSRKRSRSRSPSPRVAAATNGRYDREDSRPPRSLSPVPADATRERKAARVPPLLDDDDERFFDEITADPAAVVEEDPAPSKMDKYFKKAYDPRLDVSVTDLTDPSTGLIGEGNFDEWDKIIEAMRAQKEYKKEREIREKEREWRRKEEEAMKKEAKLRLKDEARERKRRKKLGIGSDSDSDVIGPSPAGSIGSYAKRGATREWDIGKMEPT